MAAQPPPDHQRQHAEQRITTLVQQQFSPVAGAYVASTTHAQGADLQRLLALATTAGTERVLDVATGGGHTALAFASRVRFVVAHDLTLSMLRAARDHITAQGGHNVAYCRAPAEVLPFAADSFDLVVCRLAAHHFANVRAFVTEAARILRPGGYLLISDHVGMDDPELDAFMDRFERWRDPGHVRAYTRGEWRTFCHADGLAIQHTEDAPLQPYEFGSWTARIRMPDAERDALERWLLAAPPRFRDHFHIQAEQGRIVSLQGTLAIWLARKAE